MSADRLLDTTIAFLQEPSIAALALEGVRDYLSWDDLTQRPLSAGISAADAWRLLAVLRRSAATWFPIPTLAGENFWYTLPRDAIACLQEIERHCHSDSALHHHLQGREGHRFLVRSRIQEAIATCELDGVLLDYEAAGRMLQGGRAPSSAEERLVLNTYELLTEIEPSAGNEPLSPALAHRIYARLIDGVDMSALRRGPLTTNLANVRNPDGTLTPEETEDVLQRICDYANGAIGDPVEPIPAKGYMVQSAMTYWHPLPDMNGSVARHMLRLFATSRDYPVLGYLAGSLTRREWAEGRLDSREVRFSSVERRPVLEGEIDGTPDMLTFLQLLVVSLRRLLAHIDTVLAEEQAIDAALDSDSQLNFRQRAVLARAVIRPDAEFRIRQHQTAHKVVYSTARADLFELAELGYLEIETRGKAFVFVPARDIRTMLFPGSATWDD